jgi:SAM-dependent methyltransferase
MSASPPSSPGAVDWSLGRYELTAAQLLPAARVVVDRVAPVDGERVVDIGCGTGNAALLAAARGAHVTGVDPAARLLEVARQSASAQGLDATFAAGRAEALPLADGTVDAAMSVFGVIFATDPAAAAAEMARVTAPRGRVVLSAWIPGGPISDMARATGAAIRQALGMPEPGPPFAWHDRDALAGLLGAYGFEVELDEHRHAFAADSARAYLESEFASHPLWVAGRAILEPRGAAEDLRARALAILEAGNEDPAAFRVTSRYVVARAVRR